MLKKYFLSFVFSICVLPTVFSADSQKEEIEATVEPPYSKRVLFSAPIHSITAGFFTINDNVSKVMPASSYVQQDDALKLERKTYCAKFTDGEQAYVASYSSVTPYNKPQFNGDGQPIKYYRTNGTSFEISEPLAEIFQLNETDCQAAYEAQTLEAYLAERGVCMEKSGDIAPLLKSGHAAEAEPQVVAAVDRWETQIVTLAQIHGGQVRKEHLFYKTFPMLRRENTVKKRHEETYLFPAIIGGKKYAFYLDVYMNYTISGFKQTIEPTDDPMVTINVLTPLYRVDMPFTFGRGHEIPFPAEASRVTKKIQMINTTTESNLLCVRHVRKVGPPCEHVLRLCELVLETTTGVSIMPDGYEDPYIEINRKFTVKGAVLKSNECGKWRYNGESLSISDMENGVVIPQDAVNKISETQKR